MTLNTFELRNYQIQPGMLEHFIDYFEEHFISLQQDAGLHVLGQFRLIGAPDRFVWLRGSTDMADRLAGLRAFYEGAAWLKYRARANEMIVDNDQVHLLRPLEDAVYLTRGRTPNSVAAELAAGTISPDTGLIAVAFFEADPALRDNAALKLAQAYRDAGVQVRGVFEAELSENDFPRLPVIQNPGEFVVISAHPTSALYHQTSSAILPTARAVLLLAPTLRSPLRW